jgi:hypothetical protein
LRDFPENAQLHSHYGLALQRTGRGNPREHYLAAIQFEPKQAEFYYQLASVSPASLTAEHVANLNQITNSDPAQSAAAHFALGLNFQDRQQYESAWQSFTAGNLSQEGSYLRVENETLTKQIVDQYTSSYCAASNDAQLGCTENDVHQQRVPIYIVSMPRSGSTLVEQILASHPQAEGLGESRILHQIQRLLVQGDTQGRDFPAAANNPTSELLNELRLELHRQTFGQTNDAQWVIEKTLDNHRFLGLIAQLQPNARVIICQRDWRDVFVSCYSHRFKNLPHTRKLDDLQHYYEQFQTLVKHWESVLPLPIHTVHYEQLVESPDSVTRQLVDFCGMPWSEECLEFQQGKDIVKTASLDQIRKPIYSTSVGRWQTYAKFLGQ